MKDIRIVNLRALAIVIVVLGHSIILYDPSWGVMHTTVEMPLFQYVKEGINFIQMKLFFSISGFLLYYQYKNGKLGSWQLFMKKKSMRLLVPYLMIALLWMNPIKTLLNVPGYEFSPKLLLNQAIGLDCGHLWFLPTLALIFIMVFALLKLNEQFTRYKNFGIWGILCLFMALNIIHFVFPSIFLISNAMYYAVYLYFGFILNHELNNVKSGGGKLFLLFFLMSIFTYPVHYKIFELFASFTLLTLLYIIPNKTFKPITTISDNSYGIYLFHSPLIYVTYTFMANDNPWIVAGLNFVIFGIVAMFMTMLINRTQLRFIIGNR